ncbi:hypothetical protein [Streptomyces sp. NBC_01174]|uniref:hypothetical protein n=1 Tax=Streptomyces sp. NBC_01174 TaxID=2903758 RepID=UPI00386A8E2E
MVDGIRFRVRTGVPRRDVPVEYGPWAVSVARLRCPCGAPVRLRRAWRRLVGPCGPSPW